MHRWPRGDRAVPEMRQRVPVRHRDGDPVRRERSSLSRPGAARPEAPRRVVRGKGADGRPQSGCGSGSVSVLCEGLGRQPAPRRRRSDQRKSGCEPFAHQTLCSHPHTLIACESHRCAAHRRSVRGPTTDRAAHIPTSSRGHTPSANGTFDRSRRAFHPLIIAPRNARPRAASPAFCRSRRTQ